LPSPMHLFVALLLILVILKGLVIALHYQDI
jgi:hypothetical protein